MKKKKSSPSFKKIHLLGKVSLDGEKYRIAMNAPNLLQHFLKTHAKVNDDVVLEVVLKRPKRSQSQNNFLFVYLDLISLSCGHTVEELHKWVNGKLLSKGITEVFGDKVRMVGSTSDLNISEFCELINRIYEETEIPIPDPAPFKLPLTYAEYGKLRLIQEEKYKHYKNKLVSWKN